MRKFYNKVGFTLIEIAIVLIIIGLLIGGILVGRSLITSVERQRLFAEIGQYNTATATFLAKYGALPGDLGAQAATDYGFNARSGAPNAGDGNGRVLGNDSTADSIGVEIQCFWMDLAKAGLIKLSFNNTCPGPINISPTQWDNYLPHPAGAKVYAMLTYFNPVSLPGYIPFPNHDYLAKHYYYIGMPRHAQGGAWNGVILSTTAMFTPNEMLEIDTKFDDGHPRGGIVRYRRGGGFVTPYEGIPSAPGSWRCTDPTDLGQYNLAYGDTKICNMLIEATGF